MVEVALVVALVRLAHGGVDNGHATLRVAELVGSGVGGSVDDHVELRVTRKHGVQHATRVVEKLIRAGQPVVDLAFRVEHVVDVEHHERLLGPLGVQLGDHLPRTDSPVALAVGLAPLLSTVEHEAQGLGRLVAALDDGLGHAERNAATESVVEEGMVVAVHVRAHKDELVALAGDVAPDVGALAAQRDDGLRVERHKRLAAALRDGLEHGLVAVNADGECGRLVRATGILRAHSVVIVLAKAARVARDNSASAEEMGLVGRVVDPPVGILVDRDEHELAGDVEALEVLDGALAAVDDGKLLHVGIDGSGEAAQGDEVLSADVAWQVETSFLERPVVAGEGVLRDVGETDFLHLGGHEVDDLGLGGRAGAAVAYVGVVAKGRDGICDALREGRVNVLEHLVV